jgi:Tol biopolymer transport system component
MGVDSGNRFSTSAKITPDGRFVLFTSHATDLVTIPDTNADTDFPGVPGERGGDLFVRDLQNGTTSLVSINLAGTHTGNRRSGSGGMSSDGRFVAFASIATDLVEHDFDPPPLQSFESQDVFVRDLQTGTTVLLSTSLDGTRGANGRSVFIAISADGRFVVFTSEASDLAINDNNAVEDVFVRPIE